MVFSVIGCSFYDQALQQRLPLFGSSRRTERDSSLDQILNAQPASLMATSNYDVLTRTDVTSTRVLKPAAPTAATEQTVQ